MERESRDSQTAVQAWSTSMLRHLLRQEYEALANDAMMSQAPCSANTQRNKFSSK